MGDAWPAYATTRPADAAAAVVALEEEGAV